MEATEQELYESSITEAPAETPPAEPVEEAKPQSGRARDEKGRFAPTEAEKAEAVAAEPEPIVEPEKPAEKEDARVPSWRLAEEADRRRQAEQALNEMRAELRQMQQHMYSMQRPPEPQQPQGQPADIFADPEGFVQNLTQTFDQRLKALQLENSLRFAHYTHGDKFNEAYSSFMDHVTRTRDQASYQRVMASADPGDALVQWWKEQQLHKELGGADLNTFLEKKREEWLKDPANQAKAIEAYRATQQKANPSNLTDLPPSLSRAAAARSAHDDSGASPADIYAYATKR